MPPVALALLRMSVLEMNWCVVPQASARRLGAPPRSTALVPPALNEAKPLLPVENWI